jgi:hypothetical protein
MRDGLQLARGLAALIPMLFAVGAAAQSTDSVATATLSDSGIVVRFPRFVSPDSITREMPVGDLFSGYEWRVVLLGSEEALLSALVIPPNDSLVIHRYPTIKAAYLAGDLRSCRRSDMVLECDRPARGLVRDVNGRLEIGIADNRWISMALQSSSPVVRLIVKRARQVLWTADVPLVSHIP